MGSITATNACIRNAIRGVLLMSSGWLIYWQGGNFRAGFILGIVISTIGLICFVLHQVWVPRRQKAPSVTHPAETVSVAAGEA